MTRMTVAVTKLATIRLTFIAFSRARTLQFIWLDKMISLNVSMIYTTKSEYV